MTNKNDQADKDKPSKDSKALLTACTKANKAYKEALDRCHKANKAVDNLTTDKLDVFCKAAKEQDEATKDELAKRKEKDRLFKELIATCGC